MKVGRVVLNRFLLLLAGLLSLIPAFMAVAGCYVSYLHLSRQPALHWLGLLLPILLMLNLVILLLWCWRRSRWAVVPIVALLNCIPYLTSIFNWPVGKTAPPERKVTVVSYNIRNEISKNILLDGQAFARFIEEQEADIVCLQEFPAGGAVREGLIVELTKLLPYYRIASQKPGSLIVALFSRYPIVEMQPVLFPDESGNISVWADLDLGGVKIRVFNNHLQTTSVNQNRVKPSFNLGSTYEQIVRLKRVVEKNGVIRARQADAVRREIDRSPYPVIVCGDFNTPPSSYSYRVIKGRLRDSFRVAGKGYGYSYRYLRKLFRIDFVLYDPSVFRSTNYFSPELEYSDHKPIVATFDFTTDSASSLFLK